MSSLWDSWDEGVGQGEEGEERGGEGKRGGEGREEQGEERGGGKRGEGGGVGEERRGGERSQEEGEEKRRKLCNKAPSKSCRIPKSLP